jgi:inosine/xanthosine triphosphatase
MKINVGSKNDTKVNAVKEALASSKLFKDARVLSMDIEVEEFGHPKNIEQCVDGAIDRAKKAYADCDYSVGIEGGLMSVPETKTGYMEVAVCAIYDGKNVHLGLSPAFEWPKIVLDKILNEGLDGSQAVKEVGLTHEEKLGKTSGVIGILSHGQIDRTLYNKMAVLMALIHLENGELY